MQFKKRSKGKSNGTINNDEEDYTVMINIKKLNELCVHWKSVDVFLNMKLAVLDNNC